MLRVVLAAFLTLQWSFGWAMEQNGQRSDSLESSATSPVYSIQNSNPGEDFVQISTKRIEDASPETVTEILAASSPDKDVIVSTDSTDVVEAVAEQDSKARSTHFMFFGDLLANGAQKAKDFNQSAVAYKNYLAESARRDKIGVVILTINTAYDSSLWVIAEKVSVTQTTLAIMTNIAVALVYGVDKDAWTKMTKPMDRRITAFFEKYGLMKAPRDGKSFPEIASKFFANMSLALGLQTLRMGVINFGHVMEAMASLHFWGTTFSLATVLTASGFAWGELAAEVSATKNPLAKFALQRMSELRNLVMGITSPSAKLMQPGVYGASPWIVLIANAGFGLMALLKAPKFLSWIESLQFLKTVYSKYSKFDQYLDRKIFNYRASTGVLCRSAHAVGG